MMIFKLTPTDVVTEHWAGSLYKGEAIVRAEDEVKARQEAQFGFVIARDASVSKNSPESPWKSSKFTTCERLEDSEYAEDGPAGVLSPDTYLDT